MALAKAFQESLAKKGGIRQRGRFDEVIIAGDE